MNKLAQARHNVVITGFDKLIGAFSNAQGGGGVKGGSGGGQQEIKSNEAIPVRILRDKRKSRTSFDFRFLERLSIDSIYNIVITESLEDAAFIISSLSKNYAAKFFEKYSDKVHSITSHMLTNISKTKHEVEALRKKVFDKFLKLLENEPFAVNGIDEVVIVINNLSAKKSDEMFKEIEKLNPTVAKSIRERIFLQEDIEKLSDTRLEYIVIAADHNLLAKFISIASVGLTEKFYKNMTERNKNIVIEDLEMFDEFSEKEKEQILNDMLFKIRQVLNFI